jgi:hypothetical protein
MEEAKRTLNFRLEGITEGIRNLSANFSVFRPHSTVNHPVGGRRLAKMYDMWNLGSEVLVVHSWKIKAEHSTSHRLGAQFLQ